MALELGALHQVSRSVVDVGRAEAFYRDVLGLRPIARFGDLAFFDLDGVRLLLEPGQPGGGVLYLRVADVHAAYDELRARGVEFDGVPHVIHRDDAGTFGPAGHDSWMAFFADTEGNVLALSSIEPPRPA